MRPLRWQCWSWLGGTDLFWLQHNITGKRIHLHRTYENYNRFHVQIENNLRSWTLIPGGGTNLVGWLWMRPRYSVSELIVAMEWYFLLCFSAQTGQFLLDRFPILSFLLCMNGSFLRKLSTAPVVLQNLQTSSFFFIYMHLVLGDWTQTLHPPHYQSWRQTWLSLALPLASWVGFFKHFSGWQWGSSDLIHGLFA